MEVVISAEAPESADRTAISNLQITGQTFPQIDGRDASSCDNERVRDSDQKPYQFLRKETVMQEDDDYAIPEAWLELLSETDLRLCQIPEWSEFKDGWATVGRQMIETWEGITFDQVMVIFFSRALDDGLWSMDDVISNPSSSEELQDKAKFKDFLKRLVNAAPNLLRTINLKPPSATFNLISNEVTHDH